MADTLTRGQLAESVSGFAKRIAEAERDLGHLQSKCSHFDAVGEQYDQKKVVGSIKLEDPEFKSAMTLFIQVRERELRELREKHADFTQKYNEILSAGSHKSEGVTDS